MPLVANDIAGVTMYDADEVGDVLAVCTGNKLEGTESGVCVEERISIVAVLLQTRKRTVKYALGKQELSTSLTAAGCAFG